MNYFVPIADDRGATRGVAARHAQHAPPLTPERGGGLQNEMKGWRLSVSQESGIIKPRELLYKWLLWLLRLLWLLWLLWLQWLLCLLWLLWLLWLLYG